MAIKDLFGKRINTVRKKRTRKRLSARYRQNVFSQMKQIISDQNTPKAKPTGPFKGIVIRVEHECPGGALNIASGLNWLNYWFTGIQQQPMPEMVKVKVRIPGYHSYLPDPEKYGCDPGPWQRIIDMHPTFTASSQDIQPPVVGDMLIVDFSDTETESDPIIISSVVSREGDGVAPFDSCPSEDVFNSAESSSPLAATSEQGDAQGGTQSESLPESSVPGSSASGATASPIGDSSPQAGSAGANPSAGTDYTNSSPLDSARNSTAGGVQTTSLPVVGRNEDGTAKVGALPVSKKGMFITSNSLGKVEGLRSPVDAIKRARWAGLGFVAIEACKQGPPVGTADNPKMKKEDIETLKTYVRAFRSAGIGVYLWGTPWRGMSREYVEFMTRAVNKTGALGVIVSPSWGYFESNNASRYAKEAQFLMKSIMDAALRRNFVVGFTTPWNPAAVYKMEAGSTAIRYRDCFPYACFKQSDFAVAQLLSLDGGSLVYSNMTGLTEPSGYIESPIYGAGKWAREPSLVFQQGLVDYVNYGFQKIVPAFGAMGSKYHDYNSGSAGLKPPSRMNEEIGYVLSASVGEGGDWASLGLKRSFPTIDDAEEREEVHPWDAEPREEIRESYGFFDVNGIEDSVMWWDWASASESNPCWDNTRWNVIKNFNSYGLSADLAAMEAGVGRSNGSPNSSKEYEKALRGVERFKRVATRNNWLTQAEANLITPVVESVSPAQFISANSMTELKELAQSATKTLKSSETEMGSSFGGDEVNLDLNRPQDAINLTGYELDDLGIVHGSDTPAIDALGDAGTSGGGLFGGDKILNLPSYIDYNNPSDPWQYKGGWCPVHGYTTGKGMTVANRKPSDIFYVMLHTTAGTGQSAGFGWFQNPDCGASTHYGVNTGGYIYQGLHEKDIGWSTGEKASSRPGPPDKYYVGNKNSISIEIAGTLDGEKAQPGRFYSEAMYEGLAYLVASICTRNSISIDRDHILGHDEVRKDKVDPGGNLDSLGIGPNRADHGSYQFDSVFDYDKLFEMIEEYLSGAGIPEPKSSGFPSGAAPGSANASGASEGGQSPGCAPGAAGGPGSGATAPGGVNPTTIMPLSEVPSVTPESAADSGAYTPVDRWDLPDIIKIVGARERRLVPADVSELPDGPNLTFDYTRDTTNYGKESPTKIIDQLPIATDLAHYLWAMIKAAEADGIPLSLNSVWRNSPDIVAGGSGAGVWRGSKGQQTLYDKNCASGTCSPATARPGTSKHQLGVAVDIAGTTPVGSAIFEWLSKNAEAFGFYRSVKSERWHWVFDPSKSKYASIPADHSSWQN